MRTAPRLLSGRDAAASAAQASHQFPLELSSPLAGAGVIGHAERAVVDRFLAALHGGNGRRHQQVRQLADGALAAREQVTGHVRRGNRRGSPQRERGGEAGQQRTAIVVGLPHRQHHRLEAVFQLVIRTDRQVGVARADPDQRDAQLVAEETQQVEKFPAVDAVAGQDVVQLRM